MVKIEMIAHRRSRLCTREEFDKGVARVRVRRGACGGWVSIGKRNGGNPKHTVGRRMPNLEGRVMVMVWVRVGVVRRGLGCGKMHGSRMGNEA